MGKNYGEKKLEVELKLQDIINKELPTIEKTDPRLAELLKANNLDRLPNGNIDLEAAIRK